MPAVIAKAVVAIQRELKPLVKSSTNDEYDSSYVPLDEVMLKAIDLLNGHKIAVMQPVVTDENEHLALKTMLIHASGVGYAETSRLALEKPNPQGHASAVTYGRRNNLMAMLGLTAKNDDDDGNKASGVSGKVTDSQKSQITSLLRNLRYPADRIAAELWDIKTSDHAKVAIINYEKLISMRAREVEARANATEAEATHIPVVGEDDEPDMTVEQRIEALGLKDKATINKLVHTLTDKPFLKNCTPDDLFTISKTLDKLEAGESSLPDEWYAAGHPPTKVTADNTKEEEEVKS